MEVYVFDRDNWKPVYSHPDQTAFSHDEPLQVIGYQQGNQVYIETSVDNFAIKVENSNIDYLQEFEDLFKFAQSFTK